MLVICNGNVKSGSTWVMQLVRSSAKWLPIGDQWRDTRWKNPSIADEKYAAFVEAKPWMSESMYCKQHWSGDERRLQLLEVEGVKMLTSIRDVRDALVSRYHHDINRGETTAANVNDYYFSGPGRAKMQSYIKYYTFWTEVPATAPHMVKYEGLKADFAGEVQRMFEYLGAPLDAKELTRLQKRTDFNALRQGNEKFYRQGLVDDWKNHLDDKVLSDLSEMCDTLRFTYRINDMAAA